MRHEKRSGRDRRQAVPRLAPTDIERRSGTTQRSQAIDAAAIYTTDSAEPQDYWESSSDIPGEIIK